MLGSAVSSSTPKDFQPNSHKGVVSRTEVMQRRSSDSSLVDALRHGQLNDDEAEALLDLVTDERQAISAGSGKGPGPAVLRGVTIVRAVLLEKFGGPEAPFDPHGLAPCSCPCPQSDARAGTARW
jgi:hypothetical protein